MTPEEKKAYHIKALEEVFGVMVLDAGYTTEDIDEDKLNAIEEEFMPKETKPVIEDAVVLSEEEPKTEFDLSGEEIVIPAQPLKIKK